MADARTASLASPALSVISASSICSAAMNFPSAEVPRLADPPSLVVATNLLASGDPLFSDFEAPSAPDQEAEEVVPSASSPTAVAAAPAVDDEEDENGGDGAAKGPFPSAA